MKLLFILLVFLMSGCEPELLTEKVPLDKDAINKEFEKQLEQKKGEIKPLTLDVVFPEAKTVAGKSWYKGGIKYKSNGDGIKFTFSLNQVEYGDTQVEGDYTVNTPKVEKECDVLISVIDKFDRTKYYFKNCFIDNVPPQIGFSNSSDTCSPSGKNSFIDNFPAGEAGSGGAITDAGSGVNRDTLTSVWVPADWDESDVGSTVKRVTTVEDFVGNKATYEHNVTITANIK